MSSSNEFGVIGLGRMGGGVAHLAMDKGYRVVGFTRGAAAKDLIDAGLVEVRDLKEFRARLTKPRVVMLYIPAGPAVDETLDALAPSLDGGDIVVDGGNSYWGDSIRRHERLQARGVHFVDLGTSGGPAGARHGACFMAGGDGQAMARLGPMLHALAVPGGYVHAGPPGAGHFTKLVHNGIEFGMLQAIAEGFELLTRYDKPLDIAAILECWRHGSVIRGWLIDLLTEAYRQDPGLKKPTAYIEDTGEVNWLVADALRMESPIPVIAQAVMQLVGSRDERKSWARAIVAMRHGFGGHPFGRDDAVARERHEGRVGDIYRPVAE
jgi:6-phosphogluconate dehydrogenase